MTIRANPEGNWDPDAKDFYLIWLCGSVVLYKKMEHLKSLLS